MTEGSVRRERQSNGPSGSWLSEDGNMQWDRTPPDDDDGSTKEFDAADEALDMKSSTEKRPVVDTRKVHTSCET